MGRHECSTRCRDFPFDTLHKFFYEKRKSVKVKIEFLLNSKNFQSSLISFPKLGLKSCNAESVI